MAHKNDLNNQKAQTCLCCYWTRNLPIAWVNCAHRAHIIISSIINSLFDRVHYSCFFFNVFKRRCRQIASWEHNMRDYHCIHCIDTNTNSGRRRQTERGKWSLLRKKTARIKIRFCHFESCLIPKQRYDAGRISILLWPFFRLLLYHHSQTHHLHHTLGTKIMHTHTRLRVHGIYNTVKTWYVFF